MPSRFESILSLSSLGFAENDGRGGGIFTRIPFAVALEGLDGRNGDCLGLKSSVVIFEGELHTIHREIVVGVPKGSFRICDKCVVLVNEFKFGQNEFGEDPHSGYRVAFLVCHGAVQPICGGRNIGGLEWRETKELCEGMNEFFNLGGHGHQF